MLIDFTFNVHPSALAVAHLLNRHDGIESSWDKMRSEYLARINTAPWYNGRERGLVFVLSDRSYACRKVCVAVVYEHRNSDCVCILHWEADHNYLNPPTLADIPEGTFKDKWDVAESFKYDEHHKAAQYIYDLFETFCAANFTAAAA